MSEQQKQPPKRYYIGWDVGAWHCAEKGEGSKDAIAIFDERLGPIGKFREGNLSPVVLGSQQAEKPGEWLIDELFRWCSAKCDNRDQAKFWFAIDTPLGWPAGFCKLLACWNNEQSDDCFDSSVINLDANKICNPLLHRVTETSLGQSLSAVQDQIGSQSTKAICLLATLKAKRISTGVWKAHTPNITFIETYPAPCMRSFKWLDMMKGAGINSPVASDDIFDAIVCALVSREYSTPTNTVALTRPSSNNDPEGWIFTPDDSLDAEYGVSYGRLIEFQSPQKAFGELLSQVQMALVMKAMLKQQSLLSKKRTKAPTPALPAQITEWLAKTDATATEFKGATSDNVKALFKLLHPKTKKDKVPADDQFAKIARVIQGKAVK